MDVTVLVQLSLKKEGYSVSELARVCEMDKAAISRSIRKLKEKGYVHVKEGYGSRITLCKEGREISAFLEKKIDAYIAEAEIDSIEEREAFYTSLHRISQRIEHLVKETEHD